MFAKISPKLIAIAIGTITLFAVGFYFLNKTSSTDSEAYVEKEVNEAFNEYIAAYTSGNISISSTIQIRFTQPQIVEDKIGSAETRELFNFSPSIKGDVKWVDIFTLEFQPTEWLKRDQVYEVKFLLSDLMETKKGLEKFEFNFHTLKQDFERHNWQLTNLCRKHEKGGFIG